MKRVTVEKITGDIHTGSTADDLGFVSGEMGVDPWKGRQNQFWTGDGFTATCPGKLGADEELPTMDGGFMENGTGLPEMTDFATLVDPESIPVTAAPEATYRQLGEQMLVTSIH